MFIILLFLLKSILYIPIIHRARFCHLTNLLSANLSSVQVKPIVFSWTGSIGSTWCWEYPAPRFNINSVWLILVSSEAWFIVARSWAQQAMNDQKTMLICLLFLGAGGWWLMKQLLFSADLFNKHLTWGTEKVRLPCRAQWLLTG